MGLENPDVLEDRVRGLIYGHAIGDAIGLLTEFMDKEEAVKNYGGKDDLELHHKVEDYHRSRWKNGDWTDDTDQMILIMRSILDQDGVVDPLDFGKKIKTWAQRGFPELGDFAGMGIGSTTLHVLRHASFNKDPHHAAFDIWDKGGRDIAPNGALMRTSILGVYRYSNLSEVHKNTLDICKVTHADPRCQASTVAMTTAVALMLKGEDSYIKRNGSYDADLIIKESYKHGKVLIENKKWKKEFKKHVFAKDLNSLKLDDTKKIGYTLKCLGAGFWALKQNDFRKALQSIVMNGGDADTNGAVAGALLGCKIGAKNLPSSWVNGLLHKKWLDKLIDRFLPLIIPSYVRHFEDDNTEICNGSEAVEEKPKV